MTEKLQALVRQYRELILYGLFGIGTVAVDLGLYVLLVDRMGIRLANAWGWLGATLFAFFTNKYFVFHRHREGIPAFFRELGEFTLARLATMLIQVWGVDLLVRIGLDQTILGVTGALAKVLVTVLVIIINYLASKFLIFRKRKEVGL